MSNSHKTERYKTMLTRQEHNKFLKDLDPDTNHIEKNAKLSDELVPKLTILNKTKQTITFTKDNIPPDLLKQIKDFTEIKIDIETLNSNINDILKQYANKLDKMHHNEILFILHRIREQYELSQNEINANIDKFKAGVVYNKEEYKNDAEINQKYKLNNISKILNNSHPYGELKKCDLSKTLNDKCLSTMVYGHLDVPNSDEEKLSLKSEFIPESFPEYFTSDVMTEDCKMYRWLHRRQYVIGNLESGTSHYKKITKYFKTYGGIRGNYTHSLKNINWSPEYNSMFITCLMHQIQTTNMAFPLRILYNNRFIGKQNNDKFIDMRISRYAYMPEEHDHLIYIGMISIPVYVYTKTDPITKNKQKISPPKDIENMFRRDKGPINIDTYYELLQKSLKNDLEKQNINKEIYHYNFHLYYNTTAEEDSFARYELYNYKANMVQPGFLMERYNVFHTEINQIYYIHRSLFKKEPMLYRYNDTDIYFYSPLPNLESIKTHYEELKPHYKPINDGDNYTMTSETMDNFIKNIVPYQLKRDATSGAYYVTKYFQYGGHIKNKISNNNIRHMKHKSKRKSETKKHSLKRTRTKNDTKNTKLHSQFHNHHSDILIQLDTYSSGYEWDIKKGVSETGFYNYPVDILAKCIYKFDTLIDIIVDKNNIKEENSKIYPDKAISKYINLKRYVNAYSSLVDRVYSGYINSKNPSQKQSMPANILDKYIKKNGIDSVTTITYHRFIYHRITVHSHYLNQRYQILPNNIKTNNVLILSNNMGYTESVIYKYMDKNTTKDINQHVHTLLLSYIYPKYDKSLINAMDTVYGYNNHQLLNKIWSPDELITYTKSLSPMSTIFVDGIVKVPAYEITRTNASHMLLTALVLIALKSLKEKGNMTLLCPNLGTKYVQDIIYLINTLFKKVALVTTPINEPYINFVYIVCKDYTGNNNEIEDKLLEVYKDMYKNDPSGGLNYQTKDKLVIDTFDLPKPTNKQKYYNGLIKGTHEINYLLMHQYSVKNLERYNDYLNKLTYYYINYNLDSQKMKRIKLMNVYESMMMANYLGLKINPYLDTKAIQSDLVNDVYRNLFGLDTTVNYIFRPYPKKLRIGANQLDESHEYLMTQILRMDNATRVFDTRKIENYNLFKKKLRFYERSLNTLLMNKFNMGVPIKNGKTMTHPSRAWIKMYEIAEITKLIPKRAKNYKALCFCEAPGNFILAINHFIKTRTEIKNFDWVAQSYNPSTDPNTRDFHVLGDNYELMKKYPEKWDFGPKGTGDVTDPDNIKYYGSVYDDVDLLTSDCGTDWGGDDFISSKLMYGQLLFILNNLPEGKNFVIKYYIPFIHYPAQLALFYIIFQSFEEISFYKPLQNAWSHEFYLIGKKYKKLNAKQLEPLFETMADYNPYKTPIPIKSLPKDFIRQLEKAVKDVVDRFVFYIERYIYYLDLMEDGKKPNFDIVQKHIDIRNEEWIKQFKIKKIDNKDKL